jgi:TetR/AcrR family transcriptional repressor of mexCD-oprJ operon
MDVGTHDEQLLRKLTAAMTANPRGTTQVLADMAGISRATFNRFCGSRDKLVEMINKQAEASLQLIVEAAVEGTTDYEAKLLELINLHLDNREYLVFAWNTNSNLENKYWSDYLMSLDQFFLSGQKERKFRLELTNHMLTELFVSVICGMIDAVHRNRVAASGIEKQMREFFLGGAEAK